VLGAWIFVSGCIAMFAFACATQNFFIARNKWYEGIIFLGITFVILRPFAVGDLLYIDNPEIVKAIGIAVFGGVWLLQRPRRRASEAARAQTA